MDKNESFAESNQQVTIMNSDQPKDDCSYKFLSTTDSNPQLDQFMDEWRDELYRKRTILRLNDDCFYRIYEFLPAMDLCELRATCRRFRAIADYCFQRRSQYFRLERRYVYNRLSSGSNHVLWLNDAKRLIRNFGQFFTQLSISQSNFHHDEDPSALVPLLDQYCHKLTDLTLVKINLKPETINQCKRLFSNLHRMVIDDWENEESIECCLGHCTSLKQLELLNLNKMRGRWLARRFESLESFSINYWRCNVDSFTNSVTDFFVQNRQLKSIKCWNYKFRMYNRNAADVAVTFPNMESLSLISTNFIGSIITMEDMPTTLKKLEVDLSFLKDHHIVQLLSHLAAHKTIEDLRFVCNNKSNGLPLCELFRHGLCELKTLKKLKLTDVTGLDAKVCKELVCGLPALSEIHFILCSPPFIETKELIEHSTCLKKILFLRNLSQRHRMPPQELLEARKIMFEMDRTNSLNAQLEKAYFKTKNIEIVHSRSRNNEEIIHIRR